MSRLNRPFHILVVDEDPAEARLIQEAWADVDVVKAKIQTVRTAKQAISLIDNFAQRPDLILLSYTNSVNGDEALDTLKSDSRFVEIPILVLTGLASPAVVSDIYRRRANCCFLKPLVGFSELVQEIAAHWLEVVALPSRLPAGGG